VSARPRPVWHRLADDNPARDVSGLPTTIRPRH